MPLKIESPVREREKENRGKSMVEKRYGNRTQGTECWFSLDEEWNGREEVLTPIDDKGIRTSVSGYHDGTEQRFYYVEQNHF